METSVDGCCAHEGAELGHPGVPPKAHVPGLSQQELGMCFPDAKRAACPSPLEDEGRQMGYP